MQSSSLLWHNYKRVISILSLRTRFFATTKFSFPVTFPIVFPGFDFTLQDSFQPRISNSIVTLRGRGGGGGALMRLVLFLAFNNPDDFWRSGTKLDSFYNRFPFCFQLFPVYFLVGLLFRLCGNLLEFEVIDAVSHVFFPISLLIFVPPILLLPTVCFVGSLLVCWGSVSLLLAAWHGRR